MRLHYAVETDTKERRKSLLRSRRLLLTRVRSRVCRRGSVQAIRFVAEVDLLELVTGILLMISISSGNGQSKGR